MHMRQRPRRLNSDLSRREMLTALPILSLAGAVRLLAADNPLHVLKADDIERLRMDFNASRSKVRLLFLLSPT